MVVGCDRRWLMGVCGETAKNETVVVFGVRYLLLLVLLLYSRQQCTAYKRTCYL